MPGKVKGAEPVAITMFFVLYDFLSLCHKLQHHLGEKLLPLPFK